MTLEELLVKFGVDVEALDEGLDELNAKVKAAAKEAVSHWDGFAALGQKLMGAGAALTAGLTTPILGFGAASAKTFGDFESSLNRASAQGDIYGADLEKLKEQALDLGAKTQFSAKQAAGGMAELASAGFKTTEIMSAMPGVLNLAAAGSVSVGEAAKITKDILGQFGIEASKTQNTVDVMTKIMTETSASMSELASTMQYVGPVAKSMGMSLEQTGAAIIELDKAGIRGSEAGTALRAMLASLVSPSDKAATAMDQLGIKISDSSGKILPFEQIMEQFRQGLAKVPGDADKAALTTQIFGREALAAATVLTSQGGPALQNYEGLLKDVSGTSENVAKTLNSGLNGAIEKMKGAIETAGISIGQSLAPTLVSLAGLVESVANKAADFARWFGTLPEPVRTTTLAVTALVAAVGPLLLASGTLISSIASVGQGLSLFSGHAGAATTQVNQLAAAKSGLANIASSLLAPGIVAVSAALVGLQFSQVASQASEFWQALTYTSEKADQGKSILDKLRDSLFGAAEASKAVGDQCTSAGEKVELFGESFGSLADRVSRVKWTDFLTPLGMLRLKIDEATDAIKILRGVWPEMEKSGTQALDKLRDANLAGMKVQAEHAMHVHDAQKASLKLAEAQDKLKNQTAGASGATRDAAEKLRQAEAEARKLQQAQEDLEHKIHKNTLATNKFLNELDKWQAQHMLAAQASDALNKAIQAMEKETAAAGLQVAALADNVGVQLTEALRAPINEVSNLEAAYKTLGIESGKALKDKAETARKAYEDIRDSGTASARTLSEAWVKHEEARIAAAKAAGQEIPRETEAALEKVKEQLGNATKDQDKPWTAWARQVSTIVTDLSRSVSESIVGLFRGNPENDKLKKEAEELRASLQEREQEWLAYQQDVAQKLEGIRQKHAEELAKQESDLQNSLQQKAAEYDQYVADVNERIQGVREKHAEQLQAEVSDLMDAQRDKEAAYEEYQAEVVERIAEIREQHREQLESELSDLRDNLRDKQQEYEDYVSEIKTKMARLQEDTSDNIGDQRRSTDRKVADKRKQFKREEEDLNRKIQNELRKGSKANREQIEEWRRTLERKREDTEEYVRREEEDFRDYEEEQKRRADRQAADYRNSLDQRTRDFREFVSENQRKQDETTKKHKEAVDKQVGDLEASLTARTAALERFRADTAAKIEAVTAKHKEQADKEVADLQAGLARKTTEWDKYKSDVSAKLDEIREKAKIKLEADEADLRNDLGDAEAEWEKYKNNVNAKLKEIQDKISGPLDSIKKAFEDMFASAGQAVIRFGVEYLEEKLFKWLKNDLVDDILDKLGDKLGGVWDKLKDIFTYTPPGALGTTIPGTAGGAPVPSTGGGGKTPGTPGGGVGAAGGGLAGAVNLASGLVTAGASVVSAIYGIRMEGTMNAVEQNTRYGMIHTLFILDHINTYLPKLKDIIDFLNDVLQPAFADQMTTTEEIRDVLIGSRSGLLTEARDWYKTFITAFASHMTTTEEIRDYLSGVSATGVLADVRSSLNAIRDAFAGETAMGMNAMTSGNLIIRVPVSLDGRVVGEGVAEYVQSKLNRRLNYSSKV